MSTSAGDEPGSATARRVAGLSLLRVVGAEARAFVRVASLMALDREVRVPQQLEPGDDVVVLVHGLMATAGVLRPLRERIEALAAARTASFTYSLGDGVQAVCDTLGVLLSRLPPDVRVHLVGHSVGGVAVRFFVQERERDPRVAQTISVAAPFAGARGAALVPGPAGRDIRSGSEILRRLAEGAHRAADLPHLSIFGTADTAVSPGTAFGVGERLVIQSCGHNGLLFHPEVAVAVIRRIMRINEMADLGPSRSGHR